MASAVLFGLSAPLAKLVLAEVSPLMLAGLLYLGAGVGLFLFRALRPQSTEARLAPSDAPWLAGAIVCGGVLGPALLMFGLARSEAGTASLLLTLEGVATALIAFAVFREHIGWRNGFGFLLIVLGGAALAWRGGFSAPDPLGPLLVAAACLAWGVDNNLTRKIANADPVAVAMWKGLIAGGVNFSLALLIGDRLPALTPSASALVVGALGYGASLVLFILALRTLGVARTGAYFGAAPFIGAAASLLLLDEPVNALFVVSALLIAAGVVIHLTETHAHKHEHEPMEHAHMHVHDEHHRHEHGEADPPGEPHAHWHAHARLVHAHPHTPDDHHRHRHGKKA